MITIQNLPVTSLKGTSTIQELTFKPGLIYMLYGNNHSGKSRFCNTLLEDSAIYVRFNHEPLQQRQIAYMDGKQRNYFEITGIDMLTKYAGNSNFFSLQHIAALFHIPLHEVIETYSLSMKKIIQFLWVISHDRKLYIFDELLPFLDEFNSEMVFRILTQLKKHSKTILISTHSLDKASKVDEIIDLNRLQLVEQLSNLQEVSKLAV